jgi:hypothetical protein
MRNWTIIFLIAFISCSGNHKSKHADNTGLEGIGFEKLIINYWTGDEYHYQKLMQFEKRDNYFYGQLLLPNYFVGTKKYSAKETKLNQEHINILKKFLQKAYAFRDTCTEKYYSSSIEDYTILIDSDTTLPN